MAMKRNPTVVFVHGAGGGGWEWAIWQRVFAARAWSVLAPDLLPAAAGIAATRLDDYVSQVNAWCAVTSHPTMLIGASLGGLLALRAASARTAALVLVNPIAPAGIEPRPEKEYLDVVPWGSGRSLA